MRNTDHAYVVFNADKFRSEHGQLSQLVESCQGLVPAERILPIVSEPGLDGQLASLPRENHIEEPIRRGQSPAIAFAACHLYRRDPNAIMVYVEAVQGLPTTCLLRNHLQDLIAAAEIPGALVSVGIPWNDHVSLASQVQCGPRTLTNVDAFSALKYIDTSEMSNDDPTMLGCTRLFAWSVFALMETYRNYAPVDFQVLNEMVRTWNRDRAWTIELYSKLTGRDIDSLLLRRIQAGYPTRNVVVRAACPWSSPAVSVDR